MFSCLYFPNFLFTFTSLGGCFEFQAQLYENDHTTPIDDSTKKWDTPFTTVGIIHIPAQYVWTTGQGAS